MSTGISNFSQIISRGYTLVDKTLLIAEFIESNSIVSVIVRPSQFAMSTNVSMTKDFFNPNFLGHFSYRYELFKIMVKVDLIKRYFCKYPVMHISFKCSENLEKVLLVGTFPIGFINMHAFSTNEAEYADKFGFTEEEASTIAQYHNLESRLEEIKQWFLRNIKLIQ
ncbi:17055_t:CDS:2, partial [Racocetra persica]